MREVSSSRLRHQSPAKTLTTSSEPRRVALKSFDNRPFGLDLYIMLQNHSSHLPRGHHRRQQSVPTALDNLKITYPARHATHHQGLSFDQTTQLHGFPELRPQETKTITNQAQPQQIIPETQLRPMARPGPQRHNSDDSTLRPQHLQTSTDKSTGCFKTDLSEQEIRDMTIDQIYDLLASRSGRQDQERSLRASAPTEDFDGTLLEREKFPTALQGDKSPRDIEIPDGQEASKRNLIQSPKVKPQRPCTPPTQINRSKIAPGPLVVLTADSFKVSSL